MLKVRFALLGLAVFLLPTLGNTAVLEGIGRVLTLSARPYTPGLLLGTSEGLFRWSSSGVVNRVESMRGPVIRLVRDPASGNRLLAATGNGILASRDSGTTWEGVAEFAWPQGNLPVLALSPGNDTSLWRVVNGLERSHDGGRNWADDGAAPTRVFDLLDTGSTPPMLYAATREGLLRRTGSQGGWTLAHQAQAPATVVESFPGGELYTFIVGQGLLRRDVNSLNWHPVSNPFGGQFPIDLTGDGVKMYALTNAAKVLESADGGITWRPLGGEPNLAGEVERQGRDLYRKNCLECHGSRGMGETLVWGERATTRAPALDDSAHAWHHTDEQLAATILDGLPDNSRMKGWKDRLSREQTQAIVAYLKTLWGRRALECQGPKHMQCM